MHCLDSSLKEQLPGQSQTHSAFRPLGFCLILLAGCLAGCNSETIGPSGQTAAQTGETGGGGLGSLFGSSSEPESGETAAPATAASLKTGTVVTNSIGMKLGVVPPGEFRMGSPVTEEKRSGDEVQHRVQLSKPIFMGIHEVTQAEFQRVMETNPSGITDSDNLPVQNVSWEQAVAFCRKLSDLPEEKTAGRTYRLPTEAEWEYACRSGSTTATSFGDAITSAQGNFDGNYPYGTSTTGSFIGKPQAVGSYEPNAWGLFDMHGNVWEWCNDWYAADYYRDSTEQDPQGPETGISHVIRGGSWYNFGYVLRSSYRSEFTPPLEANIYGFRVVASFGPTDTFEASELDNPNPTPMSTPSPTPPPAVASTSPTPSSPSPDSDDTPAMSTPMTEMSDSMAMMDDSMMSDSGSMSDSNSEPLMAESPAADSETENRAISRRGSGGIGLPFRFAMVPVALLTLSLFFDAGRLKQKRHAELLVLVLFAAAAVFSQSIQVGVYLLLVLSCAVWLVLGLRQESLPRAVAPRLSEATLIILTIAALGLTAFLTVTAGLSLAMLVSLVARTAVAVALILIGQRWKSRLLGLSLAMLWLAMPVTVAPVAAALLIWAFVFLNRAPLAGILLGAAAGFNIWLAFLVPLWMAYYRGKARSRFLTTAATAGLAGLIALSVLPALLQIQNANAGAGSSSSLISHGITAALLAALATANWFWPKVRSETTVTVQSTLTVLAIFACVRTPEMMAVALPWLILVITGGSASRGSVIKAEGLITPNLTRLFRQFSQTRSSSAT